MANLGFGLNKAPVFLVFLAIMKLFIHYKPKIHKSDIEHPMETIFNTESVSESHRRVFGHPLLNY